MASLATTLFLYGTSASATPYGTGLIGLAGISRRKAQKA